MEKNGKHYIFENNKVIYLIGLTNIMVREAIKSWDTVPTSADPLRNLGHLMCSKDQISWLGHALTLTKYFGLDILHFWSDPQASFWDNVSTLGLFIF